MTQIGFSHVAIAVPDVDAAAARLHSLFGFEASEAQENPFQGVRLRRVRVGACHIELLQPTRDESPIAKFLERNPRGGIHHISLSTDDLDATIAAATAGGAELIGTTGWNVDGDRMGFLKPASVLGALVEIEESLKQQAGITSHTDA
jgi:methylmalonyl-CoA/ethylmalonyl-CoA epimerase